MSDTPLRLALLDAATNCQRVGATATLTLKSGVQLTGKLQRSRAGDLLAHIRRQDGGWASALVEEIAAVEVRP